MPKKIFISHAHDDSELAKAIVNLLATGLNITRKDIFCTSLKGAGIPAGEDFLSYIRDELKQAKVIILLLTENYFTSPFCIAESGASWVLQEGEECKIIPIVVPPISRSKLKTTLAVSQSRNISDSDEWDDTKDELEAYTKTNSSTAQWNEEKENFIDKLDQLIKDLPKPSNINAATYKDLEDKVSYLRSQKSKQEEELKNKDKLIQEIEKAKDCDEIHQIRLDNMDEYDAFKQLCSELSQALEPLASAAQKALFYQAKEESLTPPIPGYSDCDDFWREVKEAEDIKHLVGDPPLELNDDHPDVEDAINALEELSNHMSEYEDTLAPLLKKEWRCTYDLADRKFWNKVTNL